MKELLNIAIIAPNMLPIPAIKGGAIESIIENLIIENEVYKRACFTIYSIYDEEAQKECLKYKNSKFKYIKIDTLDAKIYEIFRKIYYKLTGKSIKNYYIKSVLKDINTNNYDKLIIEGDKSYVNILKDNINGIGIYLHIHHDALKSGSEEIINNCERIITVSDYIKNRTILNNKISEEKVIVLKNAVNINIFNKNKYKSELNRIRESLNIDKDDIIIGFTGRLIPEKGIKELLLAMQKIETDKKVKLIIIGSTAFGLKSTSGYEEEIKILSNKINKNIIFTGYIHNNDIAKINSIIDIAVVPSIWDEPAGLVVLEAMALGNPLIVTNSGGIPEFVTKDCAIIIERNENLINNLSIAIKKLIIDDKLRKRMSINARERANKFSIVNYYNNFIDILEDNKGRKDEN